MTGWSLACPGRHASPGTHAQEHMFEPVKYGPLHLALPLQLKTACHFVWNAAIAHPPYALHETSSAYAAFMQHGKIPCFLPNLDGNMAVEFDTHGDRQCRAQMEAQTV